VDPRTNRRYFYSPSLQKSTWTDPSKPLSSSRSRGSRSRGAKKSNSLVDLSRSQSSESFAQNNRNNDDGDSGLDQRPKGRASSPALSTATLRSYSSPLKRTYANNGRGLSSHGEGANDQQGSLWVMALDSKTSRYYWYNRQTKVSTWRKPV